MLTTFRFLIWGEIVHLHCDINVIHKKALASDRFINLTVSEECATLGKILSL